MRRRLRKIKSGIMKRLIRLASLLGLSKAHLKKSLNGLDDKLEKYLDFENGIFIEAGANDGVSQSNTYYLEFAKGWTGLLVEAVPDLARKCASVRKNAITENTALVDRNFRKPTLKLFYANLMTVAEGVWEESLIKKHVQDGLEVQHIDASYEIEAPAATLRSLLEKHRFSHIDFFSLDVEGYEMKVLDGLDLDIFRPVYLLVESRTPEPLERFLTSKGYRFVETLSQWDYLYRRDEP